MLLVDQRRRITGRGPILGILLLSLGTGGAARAAFVTVHGASGAPGQTVEYSVSLTNAKGDAVVGLVVDLDSDPGLAARVGENGRPDCTVNPEINKDQSAFSFRLPNCVPGIDCQIVRASILSLEEGGDDPIPDAEAYTCAFGIPEDALVGASYPLTVSSAIGVDSNRAETDLTDQSQSGTIEVVGGAEVRISIGSADLERGGSGRFAATLEAGDAAVIATENDIAFEPPLSIPEQTMAATTLAASIAVADDHISVVDASGLPDLGSVVIDDESILYSSKNGNELVVARRGDRGTAPAEHAAGAIVEVPMRVPECVIGPTLPAAKSAVFSYLPDGCTPGATGPERCRAIRAIVIGISDFGAIPDGATLYTCAVAAGQERGEFPLTCPSGENVAPPLQPAQASGDPEVDPDPFTTACTNGVARVTGTAEAEIAVGSTAVEPGGAGTIGVTLHTSGAPVFATLNDIVFGPDARVEVRLAGDNLAAGIDADDLLVELQDASDFPAIGVVRIDEERISYAGIEGNTLSVVERGADGTTPASHASGAIVEVPSAIADCRPGDALLALGKSAVFSFVPDGCSPAANCLALRAIVIGLEGGATIPDGTLLYECTVRAGVNLGTFDLSCPEGQDVEPPLQPAQASGPPQAAALSTGCGTGSWSDLIRAARGGAPTSVASLVSAVNDAAHACSPAGDPVSALGTSGLPADFDTICPDGQVEVTLGTTPTIPGDTPTRTPTRTQTPTGSRTPTRTPSTPTRTPSTTTPTPTVPAEVCTGDCDHSGAVSIDELVQSVGIGLSTVPLEQCPSVDANGNDHATIDELVAAVHNAIEGCP